MTVCPEVESLYANIHLVKGRGRRAGGGLCIMSFVALLAGERHSDAPAAASPVIRHFAVSINDAMSDSERQRLKPFAPCILGTADGFDVDRAALLRCTIQREVMPQICRDLAGGVLPLSCASVSANASLGEMMIRFAAITAAENTARNQQRLALFAAQLLGYCGNLAMSAAARAWYWACAIDLLDRMCEVGAPRRQADELSISAARAERLIAPPRLHRFGTFLRGVARKLGRLTGARAPLAPESSSVGDSQLCPGFGADRSPALVSPVD